MPLLLRGVLLLFALLVAAAIWLPAVHLLFRPAEAYPESAALLAPILALAAVTLAFLTRVVTRLRTGRSS